MNSQPQYSRTKSKRKGDCKLDTALTKPSYNRQIAFSSVLMFGCSISATFSSHSLSHFAYFLCGRTNRARPKFETSAARYLRARRERWHSVSWRFRPHFCGACRCAARSEWQTRRDEAGENKQSRPCDARRGKSDWVSSSPRPKLVSGGDAR